jgi:hypothetical protein
VKKRSAKKLAIRWETLRSLSDTQAGRIAGGWAPSYQAEDTCWKSWCICPPPPQ